MHVPVEVPPEGVHRGEDVRQNPLLGGDLFDDECSQPTLAVPALRVRAAVGRVAPISRHRLAMPTG